MPSENLIEFRDGREVIPGTKTPVESAKTALVLDDVVRFVRRFVSLTDAQASAVSLWVAHTHVLAAADCTPYLAVNSAEKQSGKTRLLEVCEPLVAHPWLTGRTTAAALVRKIGRDQPALLLDESDAAFGGEREYAEALRGVLNTGYRRSGKASLCVGQGKNTDVRDFSTFCPKAIAGIGRLPDTVADRSIPIRLRRARRGEVARFRQREVATGTSELKARLAAWGEANLEALKNGRPDIPGGLSDRQADVCEPLLAIADLAGGEWPEAARRALVKLCAEAQSDDDSIGVRLLRDIQSIFADRAVAEMTSTDLAEALAAIEASPWGEWSRGKPLSTARLARLLRSFEIYPGQIQNGAARGYQLDRFQDSFSLYLPLQSVKASETQYLCGPNEDFKVSNQSPSDTLKNAVSPNNDAGFRHSDTLKAGLRGNGSEKRQVLEWEA